MSENEPLEYDANLRRFTLRLAVVLTVIAAIPWLIAAITAPSGSLYIGSQYSSDDQMVYAAWMRQAMDGSFLFDNRFAVEEQPGLTIHLYFWVLGILAMPFKGMGAWVAIPLISNLARLGFTFLFVVLLGRFVRRLEIPIFIAKTGLIFATLGGGLGFAMWEAFGRLNTTPSFIGSLTNNRLPIDVWQPEAFVFASSLVNGLFMVSLCLIIAVLTQIWDAQKGWKPVPLGAAAMLLLMNIHSYDVLIVAFALFAFGIVLVARKEMDWQWAARAAVVGLGAVPAALWFVNVLKQDAVFQARAATLTYSGTFPQLLFGILPLFVLGLFSFQSETKDSKRWLGPGILLALAFFLFVGGIGFDPDKGYYLTPELWLVAFAAAVTPLFFGPKNRPWLFIAAWASVGLILPYFPQLFQRKLAMALVIPWGFLAAYGFDWICNTLRQSQATEEAFRVRRNFVTGIIFLLSCASSLYWFQRELLFIRNNVTSTTVQPVFLPSDVPQILKALDQIEGRKVVVARPGIPGRSEQNPWGSPYLPDLNPVISGYTDAYTFAGHWSETPKFDERRQIADAIFAPLPPEQIKALIVESGATHLIQPLPETFPELPAGDLSPYGEVLFEGRQFRLIEVDPASLR